MAHHLVMLVTMKVNDVFLCVCCCFQCRDNRLSALLLYFPSRIHFHLFYFSLNSSFVGGVLTESIRRRPYQVILLDEFEKAHRDVSTHLQLFASQYTVALDDNRVSYFLLHKILILVGFLRSLQSTQVSNLLLQVFDEGRLSDSQGHAVDYRNTVILLTSNLGSDQLAQLANTPADGDDPEERQEALRKRKTDLATKLVHTHFSPEFVNRLDDVIVFNPLSPEAMQRICHIQLEKVRKLLSDREMSLHISSAAETHLAEKGTDILYGARPMKRLIQNALLNPLATLILQVRSYL